MKRFFILMLCLMLLFSVSCKETKINAEINNSTETDITLPYITEFKPIAMLEYPTVEITTNSNDPYSYIINKKYNEIINNYDIEGYEKNKFCYALYDIDGNGIKELLLGENYIIGGS